jgi:hypothetical protein
MNKLYMLISLCFIACVGNVQHNKTKSITTQQMEPDKGQENTKNVTRLGFSQTLLLLDIQKSFLVRVIDGILLL